MSASNRSDAGTFWADEHNAQAPCFGRPALNGDRFASGRGSRETSLHAAVLSNAASGKRQIQIAACSCLHQQRKHTDQHTRTIHECVRNHQRNQPAKAQMQERYEDGERHCDKARNTMNLASKANGMKAVGLIRRTPQLRSPRSYSGREPGTPVLDSCHRFICAVSPQRKGNTSTP